MNKFEKRREKELKVLREHGATNIERYNLINNFGYTFEIDGKEYDARFWANCYGYSPMRWECMGEGDLSEISDALQEIYDEFDR